LKSQRYNKILNLLPLPLPDPLLMENEKLEFFKLDEIDRKVLLWLLAHVSQKSVVAWIDYIASEYRHGKSVTIDSDRLFAEMQDEILHKSGEI
jgi:hypothetical protein